VIAGSAFEATSVQALFPDVRPEDASVVYYATDVGSDELAHVRGEVRRELGTPLEHRVIVCAARLSPYKGHHMLIEALGALRRRTDWTAWIAGGPQSPAEARFCRGLRARVAALGIAERIRFLGERRDVPRLLRGADLHCQPNVGPEPFGICFVEALWAGLPVITSSIGGLRP
jgi:glycosyltransferase involved in cell wall biosynthesis